MKRTIALIPLIFVFCTAIASAQCATGVDTGGQCIPPEALAPQGGGHTPQPVQQRLSVWANRWGAVAIDESTGDIGVAVNRDNESEAVTNAMHDCGLKGSQHCKLGLAYHNQCAALAWGTHSSTLSNAADQNQAQANALKSCARDAPDCKIIYSACSLPVRIQ